MKNFEYAQPRSEREAIALLSDTRKKSVVLAGGTDLVGLMKRMIITPDRVVNIREIDSLKHITRDSEGNIWIGAAVPLVDFLANPIAVDYPSLVQVVQGISSIQLQSQGTFIGELLRRPLCWYFRDGHGLLANLGRRVVEGDNRYHAILGNRGPAKFVNASRLAPAMMTLGAYVRIIGPDDESEQFLAVEKLYRTPKNDGQHETVLQSRQLVTHVVIPPSHGVLCASYEVRHGEGPDQPLAAAAVSLAIKMNRVYEARIVLGQVAPMPWIAIEAARSLKGNPVTEETAAIAGFEAVTGALALSHNEYKIQLAQVAVKRAILRAAGYETGGLDAPFSADSIQTLSETHFA